MREKMQKNFSLIFGHVFIFAHSTTKCHFLIRKIFCTKHYVKRQKEQDFYGDWIEFLFLFFPFLGTFYGVCLHAAKYCIFSDIMLFSVRSKSKHLLFY